jgi:tetratricopeptide (TPR) repeat protein
MPASAVRGIAVSLLCAMPFVVLMHLGNRSAVRLASVAEDFPPFAKPGAYEELGKHFRLRGQMEVAVAMYELCVEAGPDNPRYRVNLGTAYAMIGQKEKAALAYAEARRQFEAALRNRPNDLLVKLRLAQILMLQSEFARAADLYRQLVPVYPNVRADLVQVLLRLGNREEAERLLRAILSDNPKDGAARRMLDELTRGAGSR